MSFNNRIPNIVRHDQSVRDNDFIPISEIQEFDKKIDEILKKLSSINNTDDDNSIGDVTSILQEMKKITWNLRDALIRGEDGEILGYNSKVEEGVEVPIPGEWDIEKMLDKLNILYSEFTKMVGHDKVSGWKIHFDEYFEKVYNEFVNLINAIFKKNATASALESKKNDKMDYMADTIDSTKMKSNSISRLNPDISAYQRNIGIMLQASNRETSIFEVTEAQENNLVLNLKFSNGTNYASFNIIIDNGEVIVTAEEQFKLKNKDSYTINIRKYTNKNNVKTYLFTLMSDSEDISTEYNFTIEGILVNNYNFGVGGVFTDIHNYYEKMEIIKTIFIPKDVNDGTIDSDNMDIEGNTFTNSNLPTIIADKMFDSTIKATEVNFEMGNLFKEGDDVEEILKGKFIVDKDDSVIFLKNNRKYFEKRIKPKKIDGKFAISVGNKAYFLNTVKPGETKLIYNPDLWPDNCDLTCDRSDPEIDSNDPGFVGNESSPLIKDLEYDLLEEDKQDGIYSLLRLGVPSDNGNFPDNFVNFIKQFEVEELPNVILSVCRYTINNIKFINIRYEGTFLNNLIYENQDINTEENNILKDCYIFKFNEEEKKWVPATFEQKIQTSAFSALYPIKNDLYIGTNSRITPEAFVNEKNIQNQLVLKFNTEINMFEPIFNIQSSDLTVYNNIGDMKLNVNNKESSFETNLKANKSIFGPINKENPDIIMLCINVDGVYHKYIKNLSDKSIIVPEYVDSIKEVEETNTKFNVAMTSTASDHRITLGCSTDGKLYYTYNGKKWYLSKENGKLFNTVEKVYHDGIKHFYIIADGKKRVLWSYSGFGWNNIPQVETNTSIEGVTVRDVINLHLTAWRIVFDFSIDNLEAYRALKSDDGEYFNFDNKYGPILDFEWNRNYLFYIEYNNTNHESEEFRNKLRFITSGNSYTENFIVPEAEYEGKVPKITNLCTYEEDNTLAYGVGGLYYTVSKTTVNVAENGEVTNTLPPNPGKTWTKTITKPVVHVEPCKDDDGGNFVAAYQEGNYGISSDGASWTEKTLPENIQVNKTRYVGDINDMISLMCTKKGIYWSEDYCVTMNKCTLDGQEFNAEVYDTVFANNTDTTNFTYIALTSEGPIYSNDAKDWTKTTHYVEDERTFIKKIFNIDKDHLLGFNGDTDNPNGLNLIQYSPYDKVWLDSVLAKKRNFSFVKNTSAGIFMGNETKIYRVTMSEGDKKEYLHNFTDIFECSLGIFGIGKNFGIYKYNSETDTFSNSNTYSELDNVQVTKVLENDQGLFIAGLEGEESNKKAVLYYADTNLVTISFIKKLECTSIDCLYDNNGKLMISAFNSDDPDKEYICDDNINIQAISVQDSDLKLSYSYVTRFNNELYTFNGSGNNLLVTKFGYCKLKKGENGLFTADYGKQEPISEENRQNPVSFTKMFEYDGKLFCLGKYTVGNEKDQNKILVYQETRNSGSGVLESFEFKEIDDTSLTEYSALSTIINKSETPVMMTAQEVLDDSLTEINPYDINEMSENYKIDKIYFEGKNLGVSMPRYKDDTNGEMVLYNESVAIGTTEVTNKTDIVLALGADCKIAVFDKDKKQLKVCDMKFSALNYGLNKKYLIDLNDKYNITNIFIGSSNDTNYVYFIASGKFPNVTAGVGDNVNVSETEEVTSRLFKTNIHDLLMYDKESDEEKCEVEWLKLVDGSDLEACKNQITVTDKLTISKDLVLDEINYKQLLGSRVGTLDNNVSSFIFFNVYNKRIEFVSKLNWAREIDVYENMIANSTKNSAVNEVFSGMYTDNIKIEKNKINLEQNHERYFMYTKKYTKNTNGTYSLKLEEKQINLKGPDSKFHQIGKKIYKYFCNYRYMTFNKDNTFNLDDWNENNQQIQNVTKIFDTKFGGIGIDHKGNINSNLTNCIVRFNGDIEIDPFTNNGKNAYTRVKQTNKGLFKWYVRDDNRYTKSNEYPVDTEEYLNGWLYYIPTNSNRYIKIDIGSSKHVLGVWETSVGVFIATSDYRWYGVDPVEMFSLYLLTKDIDTIDQDRLWIQDTRFFTPKECGEGAVFQIEETTNGIFQICTIDDITKVYRWNGEDFYKIYERNDPYFDRYHYDNKNYKALGYLDTFEDGKTYYKLTGFGDMNEKTESTPDPDTIYYEKLTTAAWTKVDKFLVPEPEWAGAEYKFAAYPSQTYTWVDASSDIYDGIWKDGLVYSEKSNGTPTVDLNKVLKPDMKKTYYVREETPSGTVQYKDIRLQWWYNGLRVCRDTRMGTLFFSTIPYDTVYKYDEVNDRIIKLNTIPYRISNALDLDEQEFKLDKDGDLYISGWSDSAGTEINDNPDTMTGVISSAFNTNNVLKNVGSINIQRLINYNGSTSNFQDIADYIGSFDIPVDKFLKAIGSIIYNGIIIPISGIKILSVPGKTEEIASITFVIDKSARFSRNKETINKLFKDDQLTFTNIGNIDPSNVNNELTSEGIISKMNFTVLNEY